MIVYPDTAVKIMGLRKKMYETWCLFFVLTDRKSYLLRLQNFFGRRMYSCKPTRILICTGRSPKSNSTLLEGENYQAFEDLKKTF